MRTWPKRQGPWKVSNPVHEFEYDNELSIALAVLGRGSPIPPAPGTAGYEIAKVTYIMAKGEMEKAVEEVVDLKLVRAVVNRMLGPDATDVQREAALKAIPALIAALVRAIRSPAKDSVAAEFDPSLD